MYVRFTLDDSPAEYSEPVDGGTEIILKLRLSSSFSDTKLSVYSKDTIGQCKKKLQVNPFDFINNFKFSVLFFFMYFFFLLIGSRKC